MIESQLQTVVATEFITWVGYNHQNGIWAVFHQLWNNCCEHNHEMH